MSKDECLSPCLLLLDPVRWASLSSSQHRWLAEDPPSVACSQSKERVCIWQVILDKCQFGKCNWSLKGPLLLAAFRCIMGRGTKAQTLSTSKSARFIYHLKYRLGNRLIFIDFAVIRGVWKKESIPIIIDHIGLAVANKWFYDELLVCKVIGCIMFV